MPGTPWVIWVIDPCVKSNRPSNQRIDDLSAYLLAWLLAGPPCRERFWNLRELVPCILQVVEIFRLATRNAVGSPKSVPASCVSAVLISPKFRRRSELDVFYRFWFPNCSLATGSWGSIRSSMSKIAEHFDFGTVLLLQRGANSGDILGSCSSATLDFRANKMSTSWKMQHVVYFFLPKLVHIRNPCHDIGFVAHMWATYLVATFRTVGS